MPRLPNDCFSSPEDMISVEQARALITEKTGRIADTEFVELQNSGDRVLAEDIYSSFDIPPADNSAVDGYAFLHADYTAQQDRAFNVAGRSAAGEPYLGELSEGYCVKIFTGASVPVRCDSIAMIEDVTEAADTIVLPAGLALGSNRRHAGEDLKTGALVLKSGTKLRPQEVGQLASMGHHKVPVFRRIKVALLSTGDELENPGDNLPYGSIYDSNRYMLLQLLNKYGCDVKDYGIIRDTFDTLRDAISDAAANTDLVITSGGVSMGDEDHVKAAVEAAGDLHFWRIAIKPGRPLALGQVGGTAFVGLPGNPVAALVCAIQFVKPLIARLSGETFPKDPFALSGKAAFSMKKKTGRREWLRGRYTCNENGVGKIEKFSSEGSGLISSLVWSNGLIELKEDTSTINQGDNLRFFPYSELFE